MKNNLKLLIILATLLVTPVNLSAMRARGHDDRGAATRTRLREALHARQEDLRIAASKAKAIPLITAEIQGFMDARLKELGEQGVIAEMAAHINKLRSAGTSKELPKDMRQFNAFANEFARQTLLTLVLKDSDINDKDEVEEQTPALRRMRKDLKREANKLLMTRVEWLAIQILLQAGLLPLEAEETQPAAAAGPIPTAVPDPLAALPEALRSCVGNGRTRSAQQAFQSLVLKHTAPRVLELLGELDESQEPICCAICLEPLLVKASDSEAFGFPSFCSTGRTPNPESLVLPFACCGTGPQLLAVAKHAVHLKCCTEVLTKCPICRCEARS